MILQTTLCLLSITLLACHSSKKASGNANAEKITISSRDSIMGLEVVKQSDCYTCHSITKKLQGPSFLEIGQRYEANSNTLNILTAKIINGGPGSWGKLPMVPHPVLSREEVQDAVKYILSLKK